MVSVTPTKQTLLRENAEQRARLEELEDTLRAIRAGEVDALVVDGSGVPQVFTLQSSDAESSRSSAAKSSPGSTTPSSPSTTNSV